MKNENDTNCSRFFEERYRKIAVMEISSGCKSDENYTWEFWEFWYRALLKLIGSITYVVAAPFFFDKKTGILSTNGEVDVKANHC